MLEILRRLASSGTGGDARRSIELGSRTASGFRLRGIEAWGRKNRWAVQGVGSLLHFDLGEKHGWCRSRHGYTARLRAAHAIEDFNFLSREQNAVHGRQRSSHNIHAAYQFIGAAVWIDAPHQNRQDLKGLRHRPLG